MADLELRRQPNGVFAAAFTPRTKAAPPDLRLPESRGGWYPIVREGFAGAWQQNVDTPLVDVLSHPTVYACVTKIAGDIAKMRLWLVEHIGKDVWVPIESNAFSPVLRKPNHYQTPFQFVQSWLISKLTSGNTYVLKLTDGRGVVVALYVLDPWRVTPLVSPDGSVFYRLNTDDLSQVPKTDQGGVTVPASEIIHDRMNPLFHPLVGISPLYAAGIPAILGLKIETNSARFFENGAMPGSILTVPATIQKEDALAMKSDWETQFGGQNAGRVAVISDGMKFETVGVMTSDKAQTAEQWSMASQAIADAFGVPWYLVGGPQPPYNNIQALNVQYYTQCLQPLTTALESAYEFGVGLAPDLVNGKRLGVEFNRNDLLLMDTATQMSTLSEGIKASVYAINEARAQVNLPPLAGGDTPYMQQQNFPLESLADREPSDMVTPAPVVMPPADDEPPPPEKALALMHRNDLRASLSLRAVS